jgi:hypothetical protein
MAGARRVLLRGVPTTRAHARPLLLSRLDGVEESVCLAGIIADEVACYQVDSREE